MGCPPEVVHLTHLQQAFRSIKGRGSQISGSLAYCGNSLALGSEPGLFLSLISLWQQVAVAACNVS